MYNDRECQETALIGAVMVARCIDAEGVFAAVAETFRQRGWRLGGVQQINAGRDDSRRCAMKLRDLGSGEVICISEDRGPEAHGCRLDRGALADASERVAASIRQGVDLVIVNKFGKAETEGTGMRQVIALAVEHQTPVLICANAEHHPHLLAFTGDLAVTLPLSQTAIERWAAAAIALRRTAQAA